MPHHVERDGEGLPIPNRIEAKPVKRTGQIVAAVIVALLLVSMAFLVADSLVVLHVQEVALQAVQVYATI